MTSQAGTGLDGLLAKMELHAVRHPDHCQSCAEARMQTERELWALQDGDVPPPRPLILTVEDSPVRAAAWEVVDTFRGATAPALRAVVRHLHLALQARSR